MTGNHPHVTGPRATGARALLAAVVGLLLVALFRLQVVGGSRWELQARANHLRPFPLPAPRGAIFDRQGRVLADEVPGFRLTLLPGPPNSVRATLEGLAPLLALSPTRSAELEEAVRRSGREVVLIEEADLRTVSTVGEKRWEFPQLYVEMVPKRRYPAGATAAHVLGYVGEIARSELGSEAFPEDRYRAGMWVGKAGIEREYEGLLQGREGVRYVEVDARGRIVGKFGSSPEIMPVEGRSLRLSLDLELEEWIDHIFPDSLAGAVVALDPADGGVLALYSAPSYDPNDFVGGITSDQWRHMASDPERPLYNRATQGLYPPASTWKPAMAAIALQMGVLTPEETMPEPCRGYFLWAGRRWRCWKAEGHGYNDLAEAIGNSCDVYFYQVGLRVGLDSLLSRATALGFNDLTGIDLTGESRGVFPRDRSFWVERFGYEPRESEVLSLAIGQGANAQTPMRVAQFYEALARDGSAPPPRIAQGTSSGEPWNLGLSPEDLSALREGLRRVTSPGGTAHLSATLEYWEVLGKTGTAQNTASLQGDGDNDAWFAGMAGPFGEAPEIVVVVLVEHGGSGSAVAAPLAAKVADFYLRRTHGLPVDTIQTLREWVRVRGWPAWYAERFGNPNGRPE